jgi:hypothetical protein
MAIFQQQRFAARPRISLLLGAETGRGQDQVHQRHEEKRIDYFLSQYSASPILTLAHSAGAQLM